MFNLLLAVFLVGVTARSIYRGAQRGQNSEFALAGLSVMLLVALVTRHPVAYAAAGALSILKWYLAAREKKLKPWLALYDDFIDRKVSISELAASMGIAVTPDRLPGETVEAMIARYVQGIRSAANETEAQTRSDIATTAFRELSIGEARAVFELLGDSNRAVRSIAGRLVVEKGDDAALDALRTAQEAHADLASYYALAACHRGKSSALDARLTAPDTKVRSAALRALIDAVANRSQMILEGRAPEIDKLKAALAAEVDTDVLLQATEQLMARDRLALLGSPWHQLPVASRRALVRYLASRAHGREDDVGRIFRQVLREDSAVVAAAVQALENPSSDALRAQLGEPALARGGWAELTIDTERASVRCKRGGELRIAPGPLRVKVRFRHVRKPEVDHVRLRLVLADSEGREWHLQSLIRGSLFTDAFEEDDARDALEKQGAFVFWSGAPPAWKEALKQRCLLAGMTELLESRLFFDLRVGTSTHRLQMKYQCPLIDVAVLGSQLMLRVRNLQQTLSKGKGKDAKFGGYAELPSFAWLAPARLLLCFNQPPQHFTTRHRLEEAEAPSASSAELLETRGEAQPAVVEAKPG